MGMGACVHIRGRGGASPELRAARWGGWGGWREARRGAVERASRGAGGMGWVKLIQPTAAPPHPPGGSRESGTPPRAHGGGPKRPARKTLALSYTYIFVC